MEQTRRVEQMLSVLPIFFMAFVGYVRFFLPEGYYVWMIREDGPVENAEAAAYLFTSIIAVVMVRRFKKNGEKTHAALYLVFSICTLLMFLEEISWGQRIFGIESPPIMLEYNYQQELNFHNLLSKYGLHAFFIIVGFYGSFAAFFAPNRIGKANGRDIEFYVPGHYLFFYFFICFLFYFYYDYLGPLEKLIYGEKSLYAKGLAHGFKEEEAGEFLLAMGFFFFTSLNALKLTESRFLYGKELARVSRFIGMKKPL